MKLVGKIFVCLIMIMSIVFFSLTLVVYASHKNWKEDSAQKAETIAQLEGEKKALTAAKGDLEKKLADESASYTKAIAALQTKVDGLQAENDSLAKERDTLATESQQRLDTINANNKMIGEYRANIETMEQDLATAQKDRAGYLQTLATTVNNMHELSTIRGDLETKNKELTAQFDKAMQVLEKKGLQPEPELYGDTVAHAVKGTIEAVQEGPRGLLMVSLGSDDGLQPSHVLEVHRGDVYLGKIQVVTVEPNRSVCRVLPEFRQGTIQEGDSVVSRFEN